MIGVFDSGIGGLTVVNALNQRLSDYDLVYFGDTARAPYGSKSAGTVIKYVLENIETLLNCGATIIVVACNTVSSVAIEHVRRRYDIPIFEVVTPAVELALKTTKNFKIGVIGTQATINSGLYVNKICAMNAAARVYAIACPLLVPLVEEHWIKKPVTAMVVKKYLHPLRVRQIDTLILGCTYYPLLKSTIQRKIGKRVQLIDPSMAVAENLVEYLRKFTEMKDRLGKKGMLRLMVSDITPQFEKNAQMILKKKVRLERIPI